MVKGFEFLKNCTPEELAELEKIFYEELQKEFDKEAIEALKKIKLDSDGKPKPKGKLAKELSRKNKPKGFKHLGNKQTNPYEEGRKR